MKNYDLTTEVELRVLQEFHDKDCDIIRKVGEVYKTTLGRALYLSLVKYKGGSIVSLNIEKINISM